MFSLRHRRFAAICTAMMLLSCAGCGDSGDSDNGESLNLQMSSSEDDGAAATTTAKKTTSLTVTTTADDTATVSETGTSHLTSASKTSKTIQYRSASGNSTSTQSKSNGNAQQQDSAEDSAEVVQNNAAENSQSGGESSAGQPTQEASTPDVQEDSSEAGAEETDDAVTISLSGNGASVSDGNAVSVSGSTVTIQQAGKYEVSGTLSDGQIIVNVSKEEKVNLHFNGVDITCSDSAPLYVLSADTCTLHLDEGSVNVLTDSSANALSACLFSKDDLTIKGSGELYVYGNHKHGIKSNNDLKIKNGTLSVSSVSTALYGEDSIQITGGSITVPTSKDGFKVSNTEDSAKGFFYMEGGYVDVQNASGNGIEAVTGVTICGGVANIHSAKQAINCDAQSITDGCLATY